MPFWILARVQARIYTGLLRLWKKEYLTFYHENTQNHVEKPVCIFISVGGQDVLDPAMPV